MYAPVRRFFPEQRQRLNGGWRRARALHPSEDLSELPPLRSVVAGQEYHCPRTRSLRGSLPKLLWDGWVPLVTLLGRLYAGASLPHRWSSRILRIAVPFLAHPLDVIQSLDMYFSSCTSWTEKVPSMHRPRESLFRRFFEKTFFLYCLEMDFCERPHFSASSDWLWSSKTRNVNNSKSSLSS